MTRRSLVVGWVGLFNCLADRERTMREYKRVMREYERGMVNIKEFREMWG